ncbi:energy transducer TonB [Hymenobacter sp. HSC-4F20]|uniref:energy transducer TonB n=1 Tax=Hymenobacter sp. HSC-4F20 TaxID=2864135 RepID=UPI001C73C1F2|nr:energy transducer TonB [Hymenobacter sp. HSC-4F20]MBX0289541.1 energy transducer TonB [Hymenobacter sp. HSC-4F20]
MLPEDNRYYEYVRQFITYPVDALRAQTEGEVKMKLTVDAAGKVVRMHLVESTIPSGATGESVMIQQARLLLRQLRFEPAAGTSEEEMKIGYKFY